jgi:hypothetical protein
MRRSKSKSYAAAPLTLLAALLAGCDDPRFTADLATDAPADPAIAQVQVNLRGLEFRRDDGSQATLEFNDGELVDLLALQTGDPLRLFTDEELHSGRYVGLRLLFDSDEDDNAVLTDTDGEFPLRLAAGPFVPVDFTVETDEESEETLTITLDLRQSLQFDDVEEEYTLTPQLRVVETTAAAQIAGDVGQPCASGIPLPGRGAAYLFAGHDVEPDDLDRIAPEPVATTSVGESGTLDLRYALRFLAAGDYTLAFTCLGDEDLLNESDDLDFTDVQNVVLDEDEQLERDWN